MNTAVLVPVARVFVSEVNRAYPGRDHASDGSIGDPRHQGTASDHNPGPAGSPSPGKVDAVDIDDDLTKPDDREAMRHIIECFQRHPSAQYWIYQDRIAFASEGWKPRSYAYAGPGRNRHGKHGHFNFKETRAAHDSTRPFGIGEGSDMKLTDIVKLRTGGEVTYSSKTITVEEILTSISYYGLVVRNHVAAIRERLDELAKRPVASIAVDAETLVQLVELLRPVVAQEIRAALDSRELAWRENTDG